MDFHRDLWLSGLCGILTGFQPSPSRPLIIVVQTLLFYVLGLLICCWFERISLWKYKTLQLVSISYVESSPHIIQGRLFKTFMEIFRPTKYKESTIVSPHVVITASAFHLSGLWKV